MPERRNPLAISTDPALQRLLRRDAMVVIAALAAVAALAWIYVVRLAAGMDMGGMTMAGMRMRSTGLRMVMAPTLTPWTGADLLLMFAMWAVMMVGMMTPSAAPMVLLYARVQRSAVAAGEAFASTGWFAGGYLAAWVLFSLVATLAQWGLERAALLTPGMAAASTGLGALLLIVAGLYQWMPLKQTCLAHCQSPLAFLQLHGGLRRAAPKALGLGLHHGFYCVGCCWALMALLFVGGVMNLLWIAGLTILVLLEKALPAGWLVARVAGVGLAAAGVWLLFAA
ncbi:MAG: DUF2182 domain-containing protein [Terriglobales bacterium]